MGQTTIGTRIAGLSLGLNGGYRQASKDDYFFGFNLSRRLGRYRSGFSRTRVEQGRIQSIHAVQQRARRPNGIDLSVSSAIDDQGGFQNLTGSALWRHPKVTMSSSVAVSKGSASLNGQISGSFGQVDGVNFYARRISGAVAVADLIDGVQTEVFVNNRSVGASNQNGRVVLPGLIPYELNRLSVDQNNIPFEYKLEEANLLVVPKRVIGGRVTLPIRLNRTATLTLSLPEGGYPAAGTLVKSESSEASGVVGHNGFVYLSGLSEGLNALSVRLPKGTCAFEVFIDRRVSDFGNVSCE